METKTILIAMVLVLGIYLLYVGSIGALFLGDRWVYGEDAGIQWWLNSYFFVPAKTALICFGILPLVLGGVVMGIIMAFLIRLRLPTKYRKILIVPIVVAIILSALGFNTCDWMLAYMGGSGGSGKTISMWNFGLDGVIVNGWNFYFFCVIVPLWVGGFLIGLAAISAVAGFNYLPFSSKR